MTIDGAHKQSSRPLEDEKTSGASSLLVGLLFLFVASLSRRRRCLAATMLNYDDELPPLDTQTLASLSLEERNIIVRRCLRSSLLRLHG